MRDRFLATMSPTQRGALFIVLGIFMLGFVAYQMAIGIVFTKSGTCTIGFGWPFLAIETVAAVVGIVRGVNFLP